MNLHMNAERQAAYLRDMAYAAYLSAVRTTQLAAPEQRRGQAHWNTLALLHPDVADQVPAELDPFYNDDRLPGFLEFVIAHLPEETP